MLPSYKELRLSFTNSVEPTLSVSTDRSRLFLEQSDSFYASSISDCNKYKAYVTKYADVKRSTCTIAMLWPGRRH